MQNILYEMRSDYYGYEHNYYMGNYTGIKTDPFLRYLSVIILEVYNFIIYQTNKEVEIMMLPWKGTVC